jgi:hypothetical protein
LCVILQFCFSSALFMWEENYNSWQV